MYATANQCTYYVIALQQQYNTIQKSVTCTMSVSLAADGRVKSSSKI